MRGFVLGVLLSVAFCPVSGAVDAAVGGHCAGRRDKVSECFKVRGRMRAYSSYPRCRIWPVGTTRLLGVADPSSLPSNIACGDGFEVYADFLVCPLTEAKPQGLQMVCVASATNIRASEIKPGEGGR